MIELPASTIVNKMVPKNAFYKHIDVSSRMKNLFVSDIEKLSGQIRFHHSPYVFQMGGMYTK